MNNSGESPQQLKNISRDGNIAFYMEALKKRFCAGCRVPRGSKLIPIWLEFVFAMQYE